MSNVYATEPATSGRVIFETTHGPLEVQLWCRECPLTTKNFLQLCIDGFYDDMLFHRIIPGFLIQTGAVRQPPGPPTDTKAMNAYRSATNADEALERRKYELHSRIRFNHRGQLAMALGVDDDKDTSDLQPQFFITLDEASSLDGKHVIFGTISGPTIFNALRVGSNTEVDEASHQPVDMENAPRIRSVKIVDNPIHTDLAPQASVPWRSTTATNDDKAKKKKKKRKGKLDTSVLSFGDEMDDAPGSGMQSSRKKNVAKSKASVKSKDVDADPKPKTAEVIKPVINGGPSRVSTAGPVVDSRASEPLKATEEPETATQDRAEKVAKAAKPPTESRSSQSKATSRKPTASLVESRREKYMKGKKSKRQREDDTMEKLNAFRSKVKTAAVSSKATSDKGDDSLASRMARRAQADAGASDGADKQVTYHGQVLESDDEDADGEQNWLSTTFKCRKHMDHQAREAQQGIIGGDGRAASDYEVVDDRKSHGEKDSHKRHRHHDGGHRHRHHHKKSRR